MLRLGKERYWRRKLSSRPVRTFQVYFLLLLLPPPCLADLLLHPREQPADSQRLALFKFAPNVLFLLLLPPLCFAEHLPHPQCLPGAQRRRRHRIASSLHLKSETPSQRFFYSTPRSGPKLPLRIDTCDKTCEIYDHDPRSRQDVDVSLADCLVHLNFGQRETTGGGTVCLRGRGFDGVEGQHRKRG